MHVRESLLVYIERRIEYENLYERPLINSIVFFSFRVDYIIFLEIDRIIIY